MDDMDLEEQLRRLLRDTGDTPKQMAEKQIAGDMSRFISSYVVQESCEAPPSPSSAGIWESHSNPTTSISNSDLAAVSIQRCSKKSTNI